MKRQDIEVSAVVARRVLTLVDTFHARTPGCRVGIRETARTGRLYPRPGLTCVSIAGRPTCDYALVWRTGDLGPLRRPFSTAPPEMPEPYKSVRSAMSESPACLWHRTYRAHSRGAAPGHF